MGTYLSVPTWNRQLDQRYRLVVGECLDCETVNFPPSGACMECSSREGYEEYPAEGTGTIEALTVVEGGAPTEFEGQFQASGPLGVAIVTLDEDVRVPGMLCDCEPHEHSRGDRVEAVVRRIYEQEGIVRYGVKFRPVFDQ